MRVAIIGTGYVGLVTGACLVELGHDVTCVDISEPRVKQVQRGEAPFHEPFLADRLRAGLKLDRLHATTDLTAAVMASDITIIAVGTPQKEGRIDLTQVRAASEAIGRAIRASPRYHVVVVKSTVVPGTTDTAVREAVELGSGKKAGEGFGLAMNPEFLREGHAVEDFESPDRIVVGQWDERSGAALRELYAKNDCPKIFTTLRNAEMIKYATNSLLATLVSFSNELAAIAEKTPGADIETVVRGLHLDRRLTTSGAPPPGILSYLKPGCGFGGSCLPKDIRAIRAYAKDHGVEASMLDAVFRVNAARPDQVLDLADGAVGGVRGKTVAVLGLAFKPGTDDVRDSPAVPIITGLVERGARVRAHDPMVRAATMPEISGKAEGAATVEDALRGADLAIVVTPWDEYRHLAWGAAGARVVLDARNALPTEKWPANVKLVRIGVAPAGVR